MASTQQPQVHRPSAESSEPRGEQTGSIATGFDTTRTCIECGARSFSRSDRGEWYCDACGVVHTTTELEFTEPGWTPRDQRRTGPAATVSRVSVGTSIGRLENGSTPSWAVYNERLTYEQRTLSEGLRELRAVATALEATDDVTEQAAYLFRRVADEGLLVGHSMEAMAAACLHAAARENRAPFPLKHVEEASPVECARIKSAYSKLVREFELEVAPPSPGAFVSRFASDADLSTEVWRRATELIELLVADGKHVGQSPTGVAAATLYGAAKELGEEITQEELASVAYVSVVTLSRQWQTVKPYTDEA